MLWGIYKNYKNDTAYTIMIRGYLKLIMMVDWLAKLFNGVKNGANREGKSDLMDDPTGDIDSRITAALEETDNPYPGNRGFTALWGIHRNDFSTMPILKGYLKLIMTINYIDELMKTPELI